MAKILEQDSPKLRVLIANDEEIQLEILKYMFEKVGMEVTTAINGHQAFEIFSKYAEDHPFDLVILDLNMPISDGYETCQNIVKFYDPKFFRLSQS